MTVKFLDETNTKKEISKDQVTVVNFFATWCGPCQMFSPILEETAKKYNVVKVDLDKNRDYAGAMNVTAVPTTFIFKGGKVLDQFVGYMPIEALNDRLTGLSSAK